MTMAMPLAMVEQSVSANPGDSKSLSPSAIVNPQLHIQLMDKSVTAVAQSHAISTAAADVAVENEADAEVEANTDTFAAMVSAAHEHSVSNLLEHSVSRKRTRDRHHSQTTSCREFLPSVVIASTSPWFFLTRLTSSPSMRMYTRISGIVTLLSWMLLPYAPLAYVALVLVFVMVLFEFLHLNLSILAALTTSFHFWMLFGYMLGVLLCGYVAIPKNNGHIWGNSQFLLLCEFMVFSMYYLWMLTIDSNTVISIRHRMVVNLGGLIAALYPIICDYNSSPVFIETVEVCLMFCSDTHRLALSFCGSCAFMFAKNIQNLWRHPDRMIMIRVPIDIEYVPIDI
jgi:hypothetical protein